MTRHRLAPLRAGGGWALATVGVALAAGVVRTVVIARCLDPFEIGLMGIALLALGCVEAVASTGMDTALIARTDDVDEYLDPAFTIQLTRGLLVSAVLWVSAPALALVFHNPSVIGVIRIVGTIAALRGVANPAVALPIRRLEFRRVFWWSLPEVLSSLFITVAIALIRRDVWALVVGAVAGQAVATVASYALLPRRPRVVFVRERIEHLLRFGGLVSGSRALMYLSVNLDAALIAVTMGTHALGMYQFATRVAELPIVTVTRAAAQVALPALSGVQASAAALARTWRTLLASVFAVNAAAAIVILLVGEAAVRALVGERWLPAVPLMQTLAIAMMFRAVVILTGQLLDAVGRPASTLRLNAVRLALLTVLLPPLAAGGGLDGIARAVLIASAGTALLSLRLASRVVSGSADFPLPTTVGRH